MLKLLYSNAMQDCSYFICKWHTKKIVLMTMMYWKSCFSYRVHICKHRRKLSWNWGLYIWVQSASL